jgi:hypothetical protein
MSRLISAVCVLAGCVATCSQPTAPTDGPSPGSTAPQPAAGVPVLGSVYDERSSKFQDPLATAPIELMTRDFVVGYTLARGEFPP